MNYKDCAELLKKNNGYLILTHRNPDGDTVGSAAALCSALRRAGKTAYLYQNPDLNGKLLEYAQPYFISAGVLSGYPEEEFKPDYVIATDVATEGMLPKGFEGAVQLCVDHHPSNTHYAENCFVNGERASCGEIILEIIKALRGNVTKNEATLLYMALSTDTGCFKYANTNSQAFRAAAEMLRFGADNADINFKFFRTASPARIKLEGLIYSSLSYYRDGKITVAVITNEMMDAAGATDEDTDDIASLAGRAEGCQLSVTIREKKDGVCRLSLRSTEAVNSSEICAVFGGGGHAMAAGCSITGTPEKAREMILDVIDEVWK